jgi:dTDP-glucose pyrophosphorylase
MNIVIPMAGLGSRLPPSTYGTIKPLIPINGTPMINLVVDSLALKGHHIFIYREDEYSAELKKTLHQINGQFTIISLEELTRGPAETCLAAQNLIDNDEELVIANADQIMWWKSEPFLNAAQTSYLDGVVVTYTSTAERNSYARLDREGFVSEIREKRVISSIALSGIHYWRRGKDFVSSAKKMIDEGNQEHGEFYVGPTYNYLIERGCKIGTYHIPEYQHNPVGVPEDLDRYKEKLCKHFE